MTVIEVLDWLPAASFALALTVWLPLLMYLVLTLQEGLAAAEQTSLPSK